MKRYRSQLDYGLTQEQVDERIHSGLVNKSDLNETKSYKKIIFDNFFTLFNFVNIVLACIIIPTGSFRNLLFLGVAVSNFVIGSVQEIRSKRTLDKISVVVSMKAHVIREGKKHDIAVDDVVLDDLLVVRTGEQIVSDSKVMEGTVEVDESLLTGESHYIKKEKGDFLYSGSYVVSGEALCQVEHVGDDNYAAKITKDAKRFDRYPSQLRDSLNTIIKVIGIMIIPLGGCLFIQSYVINGLNYKASVLSIAAALIGMIPEGLVILTSVALAVGVMNLAKHKTLVQELYCLETLARVDTLCLDKTGTITEGKMSIDEVIVMDRTTAIEEIIGNYLNYSNDYNPTTKAFIEKYPRLDTYQMVSNIAFSSKRKFGAVCFQQGTYILGAYEFVDVNKQYQDIVDRLSSEGNRVLVLAKSNTCNEEELLDDVSIVAIFALSDKIRADAKETLSYFFKQDVNIKIISGDNPHTVSQIAHRAGVVNAEQFIDMHTIKDDQINDIVEPYTVFGRVSPQQKRAMVESLRKHHHIVAMSGDGVNDVLAFKSSDISIAMASGSDISKSSANLVLLENNFDALPHVLNEGRRVINNIEKVATLFLTKTIFSFGMTLFVLFFNMSYPFIPVQLTLISALTIGIPSFVLALEPNHERVKGEFLENIFKVSLPSALSALIALIYIMLLRKYGDVSTPLMKQLAVLGFAINGMIVLVKVARPFSTLRVVLVALMSAAMTIAFLWFYDFFGLQVLNFKELLVPLTIMIAILLSVSFVGRRIVEMIYKFKRRSV